MIRKFIQLTTLFLLIGFILISVAVGFSDYYLSKKADFKLDTHPKYLVLGHSHAECAINDSLISGLVNMGLSGESYFYTYFKAKKILEQNPSVKVVFVEFTNNQVDASFDYWLYKDGIGNRYLHYKPFMGFSDKMILAKENPLGFINAVFLSYRRNYHRILAKDFDYYVQDFEWAKYIGGYRSLKHSHVDSLLNTPKNNQPPAKENMEVSAYNLQYLKKIIDLCEQQGKKVIFIRSPQHALYPGFSNESTYQEIRKKHFPTIDYLDFSRFPLTNEEYWDLEHLNNVGAKLYSTSFGNMLNNGLLDKPDKQAYIDNEMQLLRQKAGVAAGKTTN